MIAVKFLLSEMTAEELKETLKKCDMALIPIGTVEQHGNHLPLFTDNFISLEVAKGAAERISNEFPVIVAPLIPFGKSTESIDWIGTISLEPSTLLNLVRDICKSLARMGFKKLVLVNGHGGHVQLLGSVASDIARETKTFIFVFDWWQTDLLSEIRAKLQQSGEAGIFHAGEMETSIIMFLHPSLVSEKKIQESYPAKFTKHTGYKNLLIEKPHYLFNFSWDFRNLSQSGTIGDPTKASKEKGKIFLDTIVNALCEVLREIYKYSN